MMKGRERRPGEIGWFLWQSIKPKVWMSDAWGWELAMKKVTTNTTRACQLRNVILIGKQVLICLFMITRLI